MRKIHNEITVHSASKEINDVLKNNYKMKKVHTTHFNQNEEFFLKLPAPFIIYSFPIHHDVTIPVPGKTYISALKDLLLQLLPVLPSVFSRVTYFFDPAEIFHPSFYQVLKFKEQMYLYLLRLDLSFRPNDGEILIRGTNDTTNRFKTQNVFLESDLIPLKDVVTEKGKVKKFIIEQNISQTWIGETGRGYYIEGIWIDSELTKFLSKLFIPEGKTLYPYYPFTCKYRTLCNTLIDLSPEGRKQHLIYLHKARAFVLPALEQIQQSLHHKPFSTDLPEYKTLKSKVPLFWKNVWRPFTVKPYLNDFDMKEYSIEF